MNFIGQIPVPLVCVCVAIERRYTSTSARPRLMAEICRLLDIDKMRTTACHPSSNGAVERFHATLNALIGRVIQEHHFDWDSLLPCVMAAYRASHHEATKFTPNYLVLGREVRAPVDLVYDAPETPAPVSYASYADEMGEGCERHMLW